MSLIQKGDDDTVSAVLADVRIQRTPGSQRKCIKGVAAGILRHVLAKLVIRLGITVVVEPIRQSAGDHVLKLKDWFGLDTGIGRCDVRSAATSIPRGMT
jgi:hypothetical protein